MNRNGEFGIFVDQPAGDTSEGWAHPLQIEAEEHAAADAEVQPVELGPDNYGYVATIPEGFVDSRPDQLTEAIQAAKRRTFDSLLMGGDEFLLPRR